MLFGQLKAERGCHFLCESVALCNRHSRIGVASVKGGELAVFEVCRDSAHVEIKIFDNPSDIGRGPSDFDRVYVNIESIIRTHSNSIESMVADRPVLSIFIHIRAAPCVLRIGTSEGVVQKVTAKLRAFRFGLKSSGKFETFLAPEGFATYLWAPLGVFGAKPIIWRTRSNPVQDVFGVAGRAGRGSCHGSPLGKAKREQEEEAGAHGAMKL